VHKIKDVFATTAFVLTNQPPCRGGNPTYEVAPARTDDLLLYGLQELRIYRELLSINVFRAVLVDVECGLRQRLSLLAIAS
jgi:hypothetical protein